MDNQNENSKIDTLSELEQQIIKSFTPYGFKWTKKAKILYLLIPDAMLQNKRTVDNITREIQGYALDNKNLSIAMAKGMHLGEPHLYIKCEIKEVL